MNDLSSLSPQSTSRPASRSTRLETVPTAVLGGGLAGAAAALHLARANHRVTLVEQSPAPRHKVCGDFLSAEALVHLQQLGLSPRALGAVPLHTLRLASDTTLTETPLPFPAASLTRFALDEALLQLASQHPAVTLIRGHAVQSLTGSLSRQPWHIRLSDDLEFLAEQAILATGKHDLRGHARPAGRQSNLVAFKLYVRLAEEQHLALGSAIELTLFPHGYAGLQPVEPDLEGRPRANLCLVVEQPLLRSVGNSWPSLLSFLLRSSPHLQRRLSFADTLLPKPLALSNIPYGLLRSTAASSRLWPVGDQAIVIPSLTGDGMSLALHTASLAAQALLAGKSSADYLTHLHQTLAGQLNLATLTSRAVVRPFLQSVLGRAASFAPSLLGRLARATRIPDAALAPLDLWTGIGPHASSGAN